MFRNVVHSCIIEKWAWNIEGKKERIKGDTIPQSWNSWWWTFHNVAVSQLHQQFKKRGSSSAVTRSDSSVKLQRLVRLPLKDFKTTACRYVKKQQRPYKIIRWLKWKVQSTTDCPKYKMFAGLSMESVFCAHAVNHLTCCSNMQVRCQLSSFSVDLFC